MGQGMNTLAVVLEAPERLALTRLPLRMEVENSYGRMLAHLRPAAPR